MTLRAARARWRVGARLARRQTRRSLGSSILIASLIALPVAGLVGAAAVFTSTIPTGEQLLDSRLGQNEARLTIAYGPDPSLRQSPTQPDWWEIDQDEMGGEPTYPAKDPITDPASFLPSGTTVIRIDQATVAARTSAGVAPISAIVGPVGDAAFAGRYDVVAGRAATGPTEAMATAGALDRLGIELGDELHLVEPTRTLRVTGLLDVVDQADRVTTLALPAEAVEPDEMQGTTAWYLPDLALTWPQIQRLNPEGIVALSRTVALDPPITGTNLDQPLVNIWSTLGAMLIIGGIAAAFLGYQVVLLAGAAFAVGARRQQRALATIASVGATPRDLRRIVVLQGLVLGTIGALVGRGLGIAGAAITLRVLDDGNRTTFWSFVVNPWITAAIVVFAIVMGIGSALLPARAAGKTDVLRALRGARRPQVPRASRPIWGSILLLAGIGITVACVPAILAVQATPTLPYDSALRWLPQIGLVVGPVFAQIGIITAGHWILAWLSRPLSKLGLAARIASRDAAANASRSVPALASIAAAVLLAVFAVAMVGTNVGAQARQYVYLAPEGSLAVQVFGEDTDEATRTVERSVNDAVGATDPTATGTVWASSEYWTLAESGRGDSTVPVAVRRTSELCPFDADSPDRIVVDSVSCSPANGNPSLTLFATDVEDLPALLGFTPSASALKVFASGGAIVTDSAYDHGGEVRIGTWTAQELSDGKNPPFLEGDKLTAGAVTSVHAVVQETTQRYLYPVLVSHETAAELRMTERLSMLVANYDSAASVAEAEAINARAIGLDNTGFSASPVNGPASPWLAIWLILAATGVLMLGASAVALGLARIDGRADDATLAAVGAPRGLRRRISFWQGLVIAGVGAASGTLAGLLPAGAITALSGSALYSLRPEDIPWWPIAGIALGLPLIVALVNGATSRRAPVLARRTPIA
ncbi:MULTISPECIES: FtsX-like permease family protein [Bacteria]